MKKILFVVISMMLMAGVAFAGNSVVGSKHDLSTAGVKNGEVCVFCHTPHNSNTDALGAPLWSRNIPTSTYTMYNSATIDMTIAAGPGDVSLACMSCHDGTIAVGTTSFGLHAGAAATTGHGGANSYASGAMISGNALLDTDLRNDHPIGVTYDTTLDNAFQAAPAVPLYGAGADQVECGSCHNVHDNINGYFLRMSNAASALCVTCHIK